MKDAAVLNLDKDRYAFDGGLLVRLQAGKNIGGGTDRIGIALQCNPKKVEYL